MKFASSLVVQQLGIQAVVTNLAHDQLDCAVLNLCNDEFMDRKYWIEREKVSIANAEQATNSNARLAHFELAGRDSHKANNAGQVVSKSASLDREGSASPSID
jgi:hypothetical protein